MLSLGIERLDNLNFIRLAKGYDEPFKERNKGDIRSHFLYFFLYLVLETTKNFMRNIQWRLESKSILKVIFLPVVVKFARMGK